MVKYRWPSNLNVANFVSTKLYLAPTNTNYHAWKAQMLCLVEGQDMVGFIDGTILPPPETSASNALWRRSDKLLQGWILGSLDDNLVHEVAGLPTSRDVWLYLENKFYRLSDDFQLHIQNQNNNSADVPASSVVAEYRPLYKAALRGDWETAKRIFDRDPGAKSVVLNSLGMTPLQIAVGSGERAIRFVQKMVEMIPPGPPADQEPMLTAQNNYGETALHIAAAVGNIEVATILVTRAPHLLYISNFQYNNFPVQFAALYGEKRTLQYLISVTREQAPYDGTAGLQLLVYAINAEFFG